MLSEKLAIFHPGGVGGLGGVEVEGKSVTSFLACAAQSISPNTVFIAVYRVYLIEEALFQTLNFDRIQEQFSYPRHIGIGQIFLYYVNTQFIPKKMHLPVY